MRRASARFTRWHSAASHPTGEKDSLTGGVLVLGELPREEIDDARAERFAPPVFVLAVVLLVLVASTAPLFIAMRVDFRLLAAEGSLTLEVVITHVTAVIGTRVPAADAAAAFAVAAIAGVPARLAEFLAAIVAVAAVDRFAAAVRLIVAFAVADLVLRLGLALRLARAVDAAAVAAAVVVEAARGVVGVAAALHSTFVLLAATDVAVVITAYVALARVPLRELGGRHTPVVSDFFAPAFVVAVALEASAADPARFAGRTAAAMRIGDSRVDPELDQGAGGGGANDRLLENGPASGLRVQHALQAVDRSNFVEFLVLAVHVVLRRAGTYESRSSIVFASSQRGRAWDTGHAARWRRVESLSEVSDREPNVSQLIGVLYR